MLKDRKVLLKNKTNFKKGLQCTDTVYAATLNNPKTVTKEELENLELIGKAWEYIKKEREPWEIWAFRNITIWNIYGPTDFYKHYKENMQLKELSDINSLGELKKILDCMLVEMLEKSREIKK